MHQRRTLTYLAAVCAGYQAAQRGVLNVTVPCLEQQLAEVSAVLRCICSYGCVCPWQEAPATWPELLQDLRTQVSP